MATKISSTELYRKTKVSETIKTQRIIWYGHALRLPQNTPAQIALTEEERKLKKCPGGQMTTWLQLLKKYLKELNIETLTRQKRQRMTKMSGGKLWQNQA